MPKKPSKKTLVKHCDNAWAAYIKARAGHCCEICGRSDGQMNAHHIEGRTPRILRWELNNGICLCTGCHTFGEVSAHSVSFSGQEKFHFLLVSRVGMGVLNALKDMKNSPQVIKFTEQDIIKLTKEIKEQTELIQL